MTTKLLVKQGGGAASDVDYANAFTPRKGVPFFDRSEPILQMGQRFADGECAQGYFKVVDPDAELSSNGFRLRPWSEVRLTEDASGDELTLAWMRLSSGEVARNSKTIGGDEIEHSPGLMDVNLDLRGIPFRNGWSRPAETDYERLQALQERKLNGSSSTGALHRDTTTITVNSFANGHLVEHDAPFDLEAWDYPEGTEVTDVIAHIAENAGKQWGVVLHHKDGATHKCLLYVDNEDLDRYQSAIRISDDPADWDPDDPTAPTFEPHWMRGAGREVEYTPVISGLIVVYGGTNDEPRTAFVETGEAPEDWETFVGVLNDDNAKTEAQAERHGEHYLARRDRPIATNKVSILVKASQAHLVTAGQAIETKSVVMNSGPDKESFVWRRVAECIVEPAADGLYWLHLDLENPRFGGNPGSGPSQPKATNPKPAPDFVPDPGDSEEFIFKANDPGGDTLTWTGILPNQGGSADGANGTDYYYYKSNSPTVYSNTMTWDEGDSMIVSGYIGCRTSTTGQLSLVFTNLAPGTAGSSVTGGTILDGPHALTPFQPHHSHANEWSLFSAGPFEAPAGTTSFALGRLGGTIDFDEVSIILDTAAADQDPDAIDYDGYPHDSSHFLPSDYVEARLDELESQIGLLPDSIRNSLSWKQPVRVATTANGTLATAFENGDTVDGVTLATGDRILLKDQTTQTDRGIYVVNASGAPTRATDFDDDSEIAGAVILVMEGTANADKVYVCTTNEPITIGSTNLAFTALSGGGGSVASDTIWDAKGDLAAGTGADTAAKLTVGSNDTILMADSGQSTGLKWVASQTPSTQAFGDAAAEGTADTYARGDHKHAMPTDPVTAHVSDTTSAHTAEGVDIVDSGGYFTGTQVEAALQELGAATPGGGGSFFAAPDVQDGASAFSTSSTSLSFTVTAPSASDCVVLVISSGNNRGPNAAPTQTNVTWTQRYQGNGNNQYVTIYTGAVSASAGTGITVNFTGSGQQQGWYFRLAGVSAFTSGTVSNTATGTGAESRIESTGLTLGGYYVGATSQNVSSSRTVINQPWANVGGFSGQGRCQIFRCNVKTVSYDSTGSSASGHFSAVVRLS